MPCAPAPLDDEWHRPFRVRDARSAGVPEGRLRRLDLVRPFHGLRASADASNVESLAALLRPGERFSHTTAAALWNAPLPRWADGELHILATDGTNRTRRPGIVGHRGGGHAILRHDVPVSSPVDLVHELGSLLRLDDLVAVVDHLVLVPRVQTSDLRPHADLESLRRELEHRRGRGIRAARTATGLARVGSESRRETWLRLLALDAGLPEPECNAPISDRFGRIGFFDNVWERWRIASEYDGDQHRTSDAQYDRDITRFDRAAAIGWRVIRVRNDGYRNPDRTRERLLEAFRAHGWRPGM